MAHQPLVAQDALDRELADATTLDDVLLVRDKQEAFRYCAAKAGAELPLQNEAAERRIRCEIRAGELLLAIEKDEGGRPEKNSSRAVTSFQAAVDAAGLNRQRASEWQEEARLGTDLLADYIGKCNAEEREASSAGFRRFGKEPSVHFSSDSPEWYTPADIIERVVQCLGAIDLDPCSNSAEAPNVPAARHFTVDEDGLAQTWAGRVYMNPPYGDAIKAWVAKLANECARGNVLAAIALVPARTDTEWFQHCRDAAVCFIRGRLRFSDSANGAPFPSAAVYFGDDVVAFHAAFSELGDLWCRWQLDDA